MTMNTKSAALIMFFICAASLRAQAPLIPHRPNVVFILADDLGWKDVGCYGSSFCETPHIDALAKQGMRFTQAYTAGSVCSPTRASLMTGKYPVRTGVTDYIPGLNPPNQKLMPEPTERQLALEEFTIGEAFREHGYATFYAGKWHLGGVGFEPQNQGFETVVSDSVLGNHGRDPLVGKRISERAVEFISTRQKDRPFFMYLAYHEPHTPILEYAEHIDRFRAKESSLGRSPEPRAERNGLDRARQDDAAYGSEVAGLDSWVGMVMNGLDDQGLSDNTIVVFFSDNGGLSVKAQPGPTSNSPLRAGKGWLYEGGVRVPAIVRFPNKVAANTTSDAVISSTDFYPTLLELCGLALRPNQHLDGVSQAAVLNGSIRSARETLHWHYPHYHGSTWAPGAAIRSGPWKLIEFFDEQTVELYNLSDDITERKNLAKVQPDIAARLLNELHQWQLEVKAQLPPINVDQGSAASTSAPKSRTGKKKDSDPASGD